MYAHPEVLLTFAREHHRELLAEAAHDRLLGLARRHRKALRKAARDKAVVSGGEGTLPACGEHVPAPAR